MDASEVKAQLESILKRANAEIEALAAKARAEIIEPICRKHRLRYIAGMGRTLFIPSGRSASSREGTIGNAWEARNEYGGRYAYLAPIFEQVIDLEVDRNQVLGYFIEDVE